MQQTAFRDKISRRKKFPRRLTSRKPTFSITEYIKNIQKKYTNIRQNTLRKGVDEWFYVKYSSKGEYA